MSNINGIDYTSWSNDAAKTIAQKVDRDGKIGLQGQEIFDFARVAKNNNIEQEDIKSLLGLEASKSRGAEKVRQDTRDKSYEFRKAVDYYNKNMSYRQRNDVKNKTYDNLTQRLYTMEQSLNQAMIDCEAYQDILIVPRWHYRYYPHFDTRLVNFDIDELRIVTARDMEALHTLKDKVETIVENANGETKHNAPAKTEYDVDKLAQKHLGMSYEEFAAKYKDELEFCKTVTIANLYTMTEKQAFVYAKAKAYATEMLQTTINEAHNVNWEIGERKTSETLKATGDMFAISEFEYDDITDEGLNNIRSGIMYKAFEKALISKYQELDTSDLGDIVEDKEVNKPRKVLINGSFFIFEPDGSVYDGLGKKIK